MIETKKRMKSLEYERSDQFVEKSIQEHDILLYFNSVRELMSLGNKDNDADFFESDKISMLNQ